VPDPYYMASVLFGDPKGEWAGGKSPLSALSLVDFWRINAERIRGESYFPADPAGLTVPSPLVLETITEVGLSFRGDAEALRTVLGIDPDGAVGTVAMPFPLLDLEALDVGLEIAVGAKLVTGPTRRSVLAGMLATAACAGDGDGKDDDDPTRPTAADTATTDTGLAPPDCSDGVVRPWPTHTSEIAEALDLLDTHAAGFRGRGQRVAVVDSGVEPAPGSGAWLQATSVGGLSASVDELGHGTAVIEHLHAAAPEAPVRSIKCVDNSGWANFPVAGFQKATELGGPPPDVILCSWVMLEQSVALQREIANAAERDVVVVFAAGNGTMHDEPPGASSVAQLDEVAGAQVEISNASFATRRVHAVAHPDALVVGGVTAYCNAETLEPDNVATAYDSELFGANDLVDPTLEVAGQRWTGARSVPDVCGLVAPMPALGPNGAPVYPTLTRTRTSAGSTMDRKPDGSGSGIVFTSGTSMAAAHVAGVAALLKQQHGVLRPRALRNVLMTTASNETWQPETGWGLVRGSTDATSGKPSALTWLAKNQSRPYLRSWLGDWGDARRPLDEHRGVVASPDILIRPQAWAGASLQAQLGLPAKHVPGVRLSEVGSAVYVRITNRGDLPWTGFVHWWELEPDTTTGTPTRFDLSDGGILDLNPRVLGGDFDVRLVTKGLTPGRGVLIELADGPTAGGKVRSDAIGVEELASLVRGSVRHGALYLGGV